MEDTEQSAVTHVGLRAAGLYVCVCVYTYDKIHLRSQLYETS